MASLTLDASTKIYAYRVDSIHTDTLKMAGGLGRTQVKEKEKNEEEVEDAAEPGSRKKKKIKKTARICTNLKNINISQFDVDYEIDPLFTKQTSMFDESRTTGGMFLNSLQIQDDSCQMILDSTAIISDKMDDENSVENKASIPMIPDISNKLICPTFAPFEFTSWKVGDEDSFCDVSRLKKDNEASDDEHAFDMNAVPEPYDDEPFEEPMVLEGMDDDQHEDDMAGDGTAITIGVGGCHNQGPRPPPPIMETVHLKDHLANTPLEYSYFDSRIMSAWAGPGHWKLKPLSKGNSLLSFYLK